MNSPSRPETDTDASTASTPAVAAPPIVNAADDFGSLAAAYDSIPHMLFVFGPDDRYVGYRVGGGEMPIVPPSQFLGRHLAEVLPGEAAREFVEVLATARRGQRPVLHEYSLDTGAGRQHYEARVVPVEGGRVSMLVVNVSEKHEREGALAASEHRLRAIVENEPDCVKVMARDGTLLEINQAGLAMLEAASLEEARRKPLIEYVVPEQREAFASLSRTVLAGSSGTLEFEIAGLRGARRWLETSAVPLRDEAGTVTALLGITRDVTERRAIAEALRASEARYRQIIETAREGVWVIDAESRTTLVNRRLGEMLGYAVGELLGRPLADFMDDEGRASMARNVERRRQGISESHDFVFRHRSGAAVWARLDTDPIHDASGNYVGALAMVTDVSAQRAEEEERARLWRVIDRSVNEIFMFAPDTLRIQYANRGGLQNLGYSLAELRERTPLDLKPEFTDASFRSMLAPLLAREQEIVRFRTLHRRRDGSTYPVEVHVELMEDPRGRMYVAFVEDITERTRAEHALQASEEHFRALIDRATDVIVLFDARGRFEFVSPAVSVLGYVPEEMVGRTIYDFLAPEEAEGAREFHRGVLERPLETHRVTSRLRHKDGSWRTIDAVVQNLLSTSSVSAIVANWRDITEQRLLEEQYRRAQKLEGIGRLAGGIAHDFNNVLTAVVGYASLLEIRVADDPVAKEHLRSVLHAAERAGELTRQLLAFARRQAIRPRPTRLNNLIEDSQRLLGPLLREDIEIHAELDPEGWSVVVDPSQIHQVILNLAVNARDAMPRGGSLILSTCNLPPESPELARLDLSGPHVRLQVRDTGVGIPPEILPHIFEPFFTTKPPAEGSGLGLATVYGIVSQLGGRLDVQSEPGTGTAISVYFPRGEHSVEAPPVPTETTASSRGDETILLVEDDPLVRDLVAGVLRAAGYRVNVAATPHEAIGMAADPAGQIDLLLTDEVMPGMSGRELARQLRADRPQLPVLRVSGYSEKFSDAGDLSGPGTAFLPKPYTPLALRRKVRELLDEARG